MRNTVKKATFNHQPMGIIWSTLGRDVLNGNIAKELRDRVVEVRPKAIELVEEIEELRDTYNFDRTNLKLYDVLFALDDVGEEYGVSAEKMMDAFNWFCQTEYWQFEEYEEENGWKREYLGRTSSFYFVSDSDSVNELLEAFYNTRFGNGLETSDIIAGLSAYHYNAIEADEIGEVIEGLASGNINSLREIHDLFTYGSRGYALSLDDGAMEEYVETIEGAIETLLDCLADIQEELDRIQAAYDWLDDYKANQVEYFREWFSYEMEFNRELYIDEDN